MTASHESTTVTSPTTHSSTVSKLLSSAFTGDQYSEQRAAAIQLLGEKHLLAKPVLKSPLSLSLLERWRMQQLLAQSTPPA